MDYTIRQAERHASTGDIYAQAMVLRHQIQIGRLDPAKIKLAAYLGDRAAQLLVGEAGEWCDLDKDPGECLSHAIQEANLPTKMLLRFALQCVERVVPPWSCSVDAAGEMIDLIRDYFTQSDLEQIILREQYPTSIDEFLDITEPSRWIRTKISRNVTEVFTLVYGRGQYAEISRAVHLHQSVDCAPLSVAEAIANMGAILAANPGDSIGPFGYARSVAYLVRKSMNPEETYDEVMWQIKLFISYLLN